MWASRWMMSMMTRIRFRSPCWFWWYLRIRTICICDRSLRFVLKFISHIFLVRYNINRTSESYLPFVHSELKPLLNSVSTSIELDSFHRLLGIHLWVVSINPALRLYRHSETNVFLLSIVESKNGMSISCCLTWKTFDSHLLPIATIYTLSKYRSMQLL